MREVCRGLKKRSHFSDYSEPAKTRLALLEAALDGGMKVVPVDDPAITEEFERFVKSTEEVFKRFHPHTERPFLNVGKAYI